MAESFLKPVLTIPFLLFSYFLVFSISICQENSPHHIAILTCTTRVVDSILVIGNSSTKNFVILREMSLQPGKTVTRELIEYDQNRIYSLGLFNQVTIHVQPISTDKANLIVEVSERWYIFPFPVLGIKDREWKKLYYGAGILHSNFRGKNEKLYAVSVFGYDPSMELSYRNPFFKEDGSYILDAKISYNKIRNKSEPSQQDEEKFYERHLSFFLNIGHRIGINNTFWLTTGYKSIQVDDYQPGRTISADGKDRFPIVGLSYVFDTRDLAEYSSLGSHVRFSVMKNGIPSEKFDIIRYSADVRRYQPVGDVVTIAGRIYTDLIAGSSTPSHNRVYLGYGERIRGHFNKTNEGENILVGSIELRYPIFSVIYYKLDFVPSEFSVLRFGIVAAAFADAGTVWFRHQRFALNLFKSGYGVGIHFLLPYSFVVRTDYASNEYRKGEFIFDLGTAF